jgi:hypothetical protein
VSGRRPTEAIGTFRPFDQVPAWVQTGVVQAVRRATHVPSFDSDEHATAWANEWIEAHLPPAVVLRALDSEREHFALFERDHGKFVGLFEIQYSALVRVIDQINFIEKAFWPNHRTTQFVLLAYNAKSLYSSFDRVAKGYYEDGITLTRGLYETFVRIVWMSCYPDDAFGALVRNAPNVRKFNLTNFVRDLSFDWQPVYRLMSSFAHSNSPQVIWALERIVRHEGEPERFGARFDYDAKLADAAIPLLSFVLLVQLRLAVERFIGSATPPDQEALQLARESIDLLTHGLVNSPSEMWRTTARDLDLLFDMLHLADRREDWKQFLRVSRALPN